MRATRIGVMVLGIVLSLFVIAQYASAQALVGVWFKGKASIKGYEINDLGPADPGTIVGKLNGSATIYVNIVDGANLTPTPDPTHYYVTTCIEDFDQKGVWHLGEEFDIWKGHIYGDVGAVSIWDFAVNADPGMSFHPDINTYPIFYVKTNGSLSKADFKSFACTAWDMSEPTNFSLGSCSVTFKTVNSTTVPPGCLNTITTP